MLIGVKPNCDTIAVAVDRNPLPNRITRIPLPIPSYQSSEARLSDLPLIHSGDYRLNIDEINAIPLLSTEA